MDGYEKLTIWDDPYDIMRGDCTVQTYETWNAVTKEELIRDWEEEKRASVIDPMMPKTEESFEAWLTANIEAGYIRRA